MKYFKWENTQTLILMGTLSQNAILLVLIYTIQKDSSNFLEVSSTLYYYFSMETNNPLGLFSLMKQRLAFEPTLSQRRPRTKWDFCYNTSPISDIPA